MKDADLILTNAGELLTLAGPARARVGTELSDLGAVRGGAVAIGGGKILAAGPTTEVASEFTGETIDVSGRLVMPGFVDPHTHPVFAATREEEFALRIGGADYAAIARAGGGIRSSVRKLRAAPAEELEARLKRHCAAFLAHGTTTIEAKSGYGLSTESELRSLEVIAAVDAAVSLDLVPTFLGAHEIPDEYRHDRRAYLEVLIGEMMPRVAERRLARFCDVFCEAHVYTLDESQEILEAGVRHGMRPKLHADELEPTGGAGLAARVGAISADHLVAASDADLRAMAAAGVVAVLLPGTTFHLGKKTYARARQMIALGVPVALATDCNPGTSMTRSMFAILSAACLAMRLSPAEAIHAATFNAACAIGDEARIGSLEPGKDADVIVLEAPNHLYVPYHYGENHVWRVYKRGKLVIDRSREAV